MLKDLLRISGLAGATLALVACSSDVEKQVNISDGWYSLLVDPGKATKNYTEIARKRCEGKTHCKVFIWTDPAHQATAFPMMDHEMEALAFDYTINRTTNYEKSNWYCKGKKHKDGYCL